MMDKAPGLDIWVDDDRVCMVITDASIIEYTGRLTPGLSLTAGQALSLISQLAEHVSRLGKEED